MTRVLFYPLLAAASLFLSATITNAAPQHLLSAQDIASMSGAAGPPASNLAGAGPTGIGASPAGASLGPTTSSSIPTAGSQVVPQQDVQVGSETDVVPTTGVFPNLVFQPAIQLFDPVVSNFQTYGSGIGSGAAPSVSSGTFSKRRDGCGSSGSPDSFDKRHIMKRWGPCQSECGGGGGSCSDWSSGFCDKRQLDSLSLTKRQGCIVPSQEECGTSCIGGGSSDDCCSGCDKRQLDSLSLTKRQGCIVPAQEECGTSCIGGGSGDDCCSGCDKRQLDSLSLTKRQGCIVPSQEECGTSCIGGGGGDDCCSGYDKRQLVASQDECGVPSAGVGGGGASACGVFGGETGIVGASSGISTDTVIQPIVTIQPHALQPVPVPVSKPYTVPVPVGVSVPWCAGSDEYGSPSCGNCNGGGGWGGGNCDWDQGGSDWGQGNCNWGDWGC